MMPLDPDCSYHIPGNETYEFIRSSYDGREFCWYKYQTTSGDRFATTGPDIETCRRKCRKWMYEQQ